MEKLCYQVHGFIEGTDTAVDEHGAKHLRQDLPNWNWLSVLIAKENKIFLKSQYMQDREQPQLGKTNTGFRNQRANKKLHAAQGESCPRTSTKSYTAAVTKEQPSSASVAGCRSLYLAKCCYGQMRHWTKHTTVSPTVYGQGKCFE